MFTKKNKKYRRENKDDFYIVLIKYGKQHLKDGVTESETREHLIKNGFAVDTDVKNLFFHDAYLYCFGSQFERSRGCFNNHEERHSLNLEAYFHLLEHEELGHARKSAEEAKRIAIRAIAISGVFAFLSFALSLYQIFVPTKAILETI